MKILATALAKSRIIYGSVDAIMVVPRNLRQELQMEMTAEDKELHKSTPRTSLVVSDAVQNILEKFVTGMIPSHDLLSICIDQVYWCPVTWMHGLYKLRDLSSLNESLEVADTMVRNIRRRLVRELLTTPKRFFHFIEYVVDGKRIRGVERELEDVPLSSDEDEGVVLASVDPSRDIISVDEALQGWVVILSRSLEDRWKGMLTILGVVEGIIDVFGVTTEVTEPSFHALVLILHLAQETGVYTEDEIRRCLDQYLSSSCSSCSTEKKPYEAREVYDLYLAQSLVKKSLLQLLTKVVMLVADAFGLVLDWIRLIRQLDSTNMNTDDRVISLCKGCTHLRTACNIRC